MATNIPQSPCGPCAPGCMHTFEGADLDYLKGVDPVVFTDGVGNRVTIAVDGSVEVVESLGAGTDEQYPQE